LSNVLAALGLAQMTEFDIKVARKRQLHDQYKIAFRKIEGITFQEETKGAISDRWLNCILINEGNFKVSTSDIVELFESQNIEARRTWKPMHLQPAYANYNCIGGEISEGIFNRGICLPSGTGMTNEEQNRVIATLMNVLQKEPNTLQVFL
jgi:pyridoxal phosphate-dependent aminotransferase EpsN